MFEKLQNYLNKWVDEGKADYYLSALECLNSYGFVAAWSDISNMLESATDVPLSMILDSLEDILQQGMDRVMAEHAITASEGNLRVKTAILNGLKMLVDDERHQEIIDICENGDDVTMQLSDLLEFVDPEAGQAWVSYATELTFVSEGLITRLKDIHEQKLQNTMPEETPISTERQERFLKIRSFIGRHHDSLAAKVIIEDGCPIGLPLQTYLGNYLETMKSYDTKLPLLAATALVGIVLISDTPYDKLALVAKDLIDDVYDDIEYIGLVAEAMDTILKEVLA